MLVNYFLVNQVFSTRYYTKISVNLKLQNNNNNIKNNKIIIVIKIIIIPPTNPLFFLPI